MSTDSGVLWLDIRGYEGLYKISNRGDVLSANYKRSGKPGLIQSGYNPGGYRQYRLMKNGKAKYHYAHRLVAVHFLESVPGKTQVNHIDHNPENNNVENLEWCTHKENIIYSFEGNRRVPNSKISPEEVSEIKKRRFLEGERVADLSKDYGVHVTTIYDILNGESHKKTNRKTEESQ